VSEFRVDAVAVVPHSVFPEHLTVIREGDYVIEFFGQNVENVTIYV
jgi:hypothetical protein